MEKLPIEFTKKEDLRQMLKFVMYKVASTGDYNLFLHKVYDFDEDGRIWKNRTCRTNMFSIFEEGLSKSKYSSIKQTTVFSGQVNEDSIDKILKYDYPWPTSEHIVFIIAIPKNMKINGIETNFSTPTFKFSEYDMFRTDHTKSQYTMPYDSLKTITVDLPFIVGSVVSNLPDQTEEDFEKFGGKYQLYLNKDHLYQLSEEARNEYMQPLVDKLVSNFGINENDDKELIEQKIHDGIIELDKRDFNEGRYCSDYDFD